MVNEFESTCSTTLTNMNFIAKAFAPNRLG